MTFVALLTRRAYFPRTISPKSDLLYSGRRSSDISDLAFFIDFTFSFLRRPRANDSYLIFSPFGVGYNQQPSLGRETESHETIFTN